MLLFFKKNRGNQEQPKEKDTFIKQPTWKLNTRPLDSRPLKEDAEFRSREWVKK
ncbi:MULTISPECIES: hypothetical protein [Bacillaceae]|uniref:hypothetical protein n=1 Tax=Bacillaceae TaxID=186817 RepID=UPI00035CE005|nr:MULTISPECIES: hypothetical protein [Bacillaceae]